MYSAGAMLLDPDDPSRVLARTARAAPRAGDRRRTSRHGAQRRVPDRDRRRSTAATSCSTAWPTAASGWRSSSGPGREHVETVPASASGSSGAGRSARSSPTPSPSSPTVELAAVADTETDLAARLAAAPPVGRDRRRPRRAPRRPRHRHRRRRHAPVDARRPRRPGPPSQPARARREAARHRRRRLPPRRRGRCRCRPSRHRRSHAALRAARHGAGPTARGRGRRSTRARPDPALRVRERRRRRRPAVRSLVLGSVTLGRHLHRARRPLLRPRRRPHRIPPSMRSKR